jgi:hypothetical protein
MWTDYHGVMRYHLTGDGGGALDSTHTYWFDRYEIHTDIEPGRLGDEYDTGRALFERYTSAGAFIPADDEGLQQLARNIVRRERIPYDKAYAVYRYLLDELEYEQGALQENLGAYFEEGTASGRGYGLLFVTLLRCVDIPARPVAGYIVFGDKETMRHVWAEFYLPDYGWVPADPALGEGAISVNPAVNDPESFYFGNLDNQHLTFSRGVIEIPQMSPQARRTRIARPFSLQTVYEEYHPELEGYRSSWGDIEIVGWW